ncbi:hypothetical protein SBRCBS47491_007671 [Sporothrix bragantina]|uniref:NACHT domain-containing protein n=1 Tax=Sporothrix bragantina TaxID=671064 RepID=A0ABP0CHZ0_9PEZI
MHLLHNDNGKLTLAKNVNESTAAYAILSHTWGDDAQEVLFEDMAQDNLDRAKSKAGFEKVQFCVERAKEAGLSYSWIDTCCINKADAVELNRSINSMFRWYRHAKRCYVYLSDVSVSSRELVYEITTIPMDALSSYEKSRFSDAQRFNWINSRDTKEEEDIAYCLLGLFDVSMPLVYGEGKDKAIRRLQKEIEEKLPPLNPRDKDCVRDLRLLDPRDDKTRIQETKGGLFQDAYRWILENNSFRQWRSGPQGRVLWIRGDPGKGKTMLLCGIIDELEPSNTCLSYFFCQATNEQLNHATAVLRGLIYMLVLQRPALISHIRRKYDDAGKRLFEEINAWQALCKILTDMLADEQAANAVLLVDALDECTSGLPELLQFICKPSGAKWVVSSRNWPNIEQWNS